MTNEISETKNNQAAEAIANAVAKLPANTPATFGTLAASRKQTKREAEAYNMTLYFVSRAYGWKDFDGNDTEKCEIVNAIAAAAIAKTGK